MSDAWKKNVFRKTCITYSVLEYIETMNATFTLSWQSYMTSSRYLKKMKNIAENVLANTKGMQNVKYFLATKIDMSAK